jgi:epoxide hydrolase 4
MRGAGITLRCIETGAGAAVVLLHGFPDLSLGWRHQWPALAAAGYRVIAPDLRGYGESDRPHGVKAYSLERLVDDAEVLLETLAAARQSPCAALIGHDWGGVIAWELAARRPDLMQRLAILNAPHPAAFRRELRTNPRQMLRSWYVAFSQLPLLPELVLRARDCALIRRVLGRTEAGEPMADEEELRPYVRAFSCPGALTAALNYYRAAARDFTTGRTTPARRVDVPSLVIWGERDAYLDMRLLAGLHCSVPRLTVQRLPHAGHFVHWQDAGTVNALLLAFLR